MFTTQDKFEFILLSRGMGTWGTVDHPVLLEKRYYVLLLEWNGPVAERRGFGMLKMEAVADSLPPGPQWKEILLG